MISGDRHTPGELEEKMIEFKNTENQSEQTYDYKSTFTKIKVMNSSKVPSEQYARWVQGCRGAMQ